jgi:hypothetical protein
LNNIVLFYSSLFRNKKSNKWIGNGIAENSDLNELIKTGEIFKSEEYENKKIYPSRGYCHNIGRSPWNYD